jgi:hypothetical protein
LRVLHRARFTAAMPQTAPRSAAIPGVVYARTAEGFTLPVIDVTHPAFAVAADAAAVAELRRQFAEEDRRRSRVPRFLLRWLLQRMGRSSRFARALFARGATVLPGAVTYAMKLGAANLVPPFDSPIDRTLAASAQATSMRIRLQQLARLLAEALAEELAAHAALPLHLLNVGGGTAIDSLNALILLQRHAPGLLRRPIAIHVLDPDPEGAQFGVRALSALLDGPLHGVSARLVHLGYDWVNAAPLAELVQRLAHEGAVLAASTEGALFEYGADEVVVENLRALCAGPGVRLVAGTVTRADPLARAALAHNPFRLYPRGADGLAPLARRAGFVVAQVESALLSDQVLLRRA